MIIHARFRGKWLGPALQTYFIGNNLASLFAPMVNTLFVEQRNISLFTNFSAPCCSSRQSHTLEMFTLINITSVSLNRNYTTALNSTGGTVSINIDNEYTALAPYYLVPTMSMAFASMVSLCSFGLSKTVKNILVIKKNEDWSDNKQDIGDRDLTEIILLTGMVILEICRSGVMNGAYGLMVTYMVKHLKMEKTTASLVTSSGYLASVLSQLVGIVLIRYIPAPVCLGIINFTLVIINIVFTLTLDHHHGFIWIWAIFNGALLSNIKMALYTWFYQSISVTAFRTSLLLVGLTSGAMAGSALTGYMMTRYNPGWFIFTLDGILVYSNIIFVAVYSYYIYVTRRVRNYKLLR